MTAGAPLLWVWLLAAGGLRVETGSPEALCPDLGQVRAAARARLGDIEGQGDWLASYTLVHRPDASEGGDVVRLELTDPAGRLRLRRDLVRAGESCAALARALVVVLDGYFRHPSPADDAAPARPVAIVNAPAATAAPAPARLRVDLSGGLAGAWDGGGATSPSVVVGVRGALSPTFWWAGLEGAWLSSRPAQAIDAQPATMRSYALRGFFTRDLARDLFPRDRFHTDALGLLVGPEVMLALDRANAPTLVDGAEKTRASWGAGGRAQLQLRVARRAFVSLLAAIDYAPTAWGGAFLIGTPAGEVEIFSKPRWRMLLAAGLSLAVF